VARILLAEDDADIRWLVELTLSRHCHDVVAVADGAAAIEACRERRPDLAVLDIGMPVLSGVDALRAIRSDPALAGLPVILLTGWARPSDVEDGRDAGADDYVTKPFSPHELVVRIEALLGDEG
jgi:two-component system response regulator MtrA